MQVSELQASLSNTDWGLLDRAKVVGLKSGPARQAIAFETGFERPAGADGETRQGVQDGVGNETVLRGDF